MEFRVCISQKEETADTNMIGVTHEWEIRSPHSYAAIASGIAFSDAEARAEAARAVARYLCVVSTEATTKSVHVTALEKAMEVASQSHYRSYMDQYTKRIAAEEDNKKLTALLADLAPKPDPEPISESDPDPDRDCGENDVIVGAIEL